MVWPAMLCRLQGVILKTSIGETMNLSLKVTQGFFFYSVGFISKVSCQKLIKDSVAILKKERAVRKKMGRVERRSVGICY